MSIEMPLPEAVPADWAPGEIVFARFRYTRDPAGEPVFDASPLSCAVRRTNVVDFVRGLAGGAEPQCEQRYHKHLDDPHPCPPGPLDIYTHGPCYVVIQLEGDTWQFRRDGPAVTAKNDYENDNSALKHVDAAGEVIPGNQPGQDGCRIVFFSVVKRRKWDHQFFNYHVEFLDGAGGRTGFTIDPDVPNDGGKFPFV